MQYRKTVVACVLNLVVRTRVCSCYLTEDVRLPQDSLYSLSSFSVTVMRTKGNIRFKGYSSGVMGKLYRALLRRQRCFLTAVVDINEFRTSKSATIVMVWIWKKYESLTALVPMVPRPVKPVVLYDDDTLLQ
ncbi:hypothetical protein BDF20DRAFT_891453 [Mycotypha africana]|uniref:uncharacterized protein n=1 Tax=Mycotypha africana TaxID=64632 RepID=UPI0023008736|nr:uncharacterized protein BDF20DRAFT_891453 [Mycotypha africana]KAI8970462.1 hypothetical protein BDF20DRAFT_891453 [Mycotypha africana]